VTAGRSSAGEANGGMPISYEHLKMLADDGAKSAHRALRGGQRHSDPAGQGFVVEALAMRLANRAGMRKAKVALA
jgi:hypothetical protein